MLKRGSSSQVIAIFVELPSKTDCKKSASTSTASTGRFPTDLSCVVKYEEVSPDFNKQPTRHGQNGNNFWAPPNIKGAYRRDKARAKLFRWMGGRVEEIDSSSLGTLIPYKAATVFTQYPDTHHLLAVDFDAETKDVADEPGGWKVLSFNHRPLPGAQETYYSSIALFGAEQQLAAPGSTQWVPQLLPKIYDYDSSGSATSTPKSAGLIGSLPILFALPAFSAPPNQLSRVLTGCLRPSGWVPHPFLHGCNKFRGVVVTIYLDPANKKTSTRTLLDHLADGYWGPFYQP